MKRPQKNAVLTVGGGALTMSLLTACPQPPPPPTFTTLEFRFPETAQTNGLTLAAIYFVDGSDPAQKAGVQVLANGSLGRDGQFVYPGGPNASAMVNSGTLQLASYALDPLKKNAGCLRLFKTSEASGLQDVVITPETVKTCNVYFTLFRDADGDGTPTKGEELFNTHDIYSYADAAFTYSFASTDGKSQEKGARVSGWSLVRHEVLQPTATPGQYRVTMNSVLTTDQRLTIRLHEPTDRLISMGLKGLDRGGLK